MQNGRQRQDSPLQRLANSALPPLSKYYYGPAQVSPRGSPANDDTAFDVPPTLPPRCSPGPPNHTPRQGVNPSSNPPPLDAGQTWQNYFENLPGFQPSAPPASQFPSAPYNPNTYGLMPSAQQSPLHPAFRQPAIFGTSSDKSTWGVKFNSNHGIGSTPSSKPPQLPPRPHNANNDNPGQIHHHLQSDPPPQVSQNHRNPEILQPVAYSSQPPSVPQSHLLVSHDDMINPQSRHESTILSPVLPPPPPPPLPPPHPPKLPQAYENEIQPRSQAMGSYPSDSPHTHMYHYEPSLSHEPYQYQQPPIDQGQQNGSAYEAISPQVNLQDRPTFPPPLNPNSTYVAQNSNFDQPHTGQLLHQSSISPVGSGDDIRWVPETNQWESRTPYIPSPQLHHAVLSQGVRKQSTVITQVPPTVYPTNQQAQGTNQTLSNTTVSQGPQTSTPQDEARTQDASIHEPETNNSFYWHSPHSSSDNTNDHSQTFSSPTTPLNATSSSQVPPIPTSATERTRSSTYSQTTNMYHSDLGIYNASALGFGGPSDWEHFGDYEAEEVDDTDLYSRAEPPSHVPVSSDFAELPADSLPPGRSQQLKPADLVERASAVHNSASLSTDCMKVETSLSAAGSVRNLEALAKVARETMSSDSGMQAQIPISNGTDKPGSQSERSSSDFNQAEATVDEPIQAWSHAPNPQAQRSSSPAFSNHSSQMKSINKVYTLMQSDHSRPESNSESPLRHTEQLLKNSDQPANTTEKQDSCHDISLNEDQITLKHTDYLNPIQVSQVQDDSRHSIPPLLVGSPLVPKGSPDQAASQDTGASGATSSLSSGGPDQKSFERDMPQDSENDVQKHLVVATSPSLPSKRIDASDPYANLDPWAKASLNRYVAMLREEARAETDKDKFKIFEVFISRETRLRAVLYGTDAEPPTQRNIPVKETPVRRTNTTNLPHASKALPALPVDADSSPRKPPALTMVQVTPEPDTASVQDQASNLSTGDQSYVMVDSSDDVQYSPGGRPIVSSATNADQSYDSNTSKYKSNSDAPNTVGSGNIPGVQKPAYTPFRYSQPDATDLSTKRQSYRPYAALKISSSGVRPKTSDQTDDRITSRMDPNENIFVGSSKDDGDIAIKDLGGLDAPTTQHNSREPLDLRRFEKADFDPLVSVLPRSGIIHDETISLQGWKRRMDAVPDDFSFIHQSVVAWDARAKKLRENHEKARHARQVESEQRIDALFDDHEIGYGDISELESEFKRSEAATKADEDRSEYQTFVTEVFDLVWTRLHFEIDQLTPLYNEYTDLLNETLAGKDMFDGASDRFAIAPTMDSLLALHQKLEVRHQKAFEAVLERDRRLKKTELSPWYSLGNVTKVKQLEKQFEQAEKNAIVEYCHQRDVRANQLMDSLDQNTLRGVGANQDYMELIHRAVCRVASQRAFASAPNSNEPEVGLDEVMRAKTVTAALATSSEQIVQTFHVADMLLNAADYEVSVATAKLANADLATFRRLSEEKAKEDHKLLRDLEHRLALIREDSRKTNDEIVKLLCFLGVQNGQAEAPQRVAGRADPGQQERLQKALEEAKRRNASKEMLV